MNTRKPKFTFFLPATPVTESMGEQIRIIAGERGVSVAEVQREAFSLFLRQNASLAIEIASSTSQEKAS